MRKILIAAAALATLGVAVPATAQESIAVPYRDLNLATPEGQRALDNRINRAARQVCFLDEVQTGTRLRDPAKQECYRQARLKARQAMASLIAAEQRGG
jgi:UrcA family protein